VKKIILLCVALGVTSCAQMRQATPDQRYEAYRAELSAERASGTITAVKEQENLRDRYWEVYGRDADSAGHFAYAISLMGSAEAAWSVRSSGHSQRARREGLSQPTS
jgi:hypothetical protein